LMLLYLLASFLDLLPEIGYNVCNNRGLRHAM
jgi:hypothetical protein